MRKKPNQQFDTHEYFRRVVEQGHCAVILFKDTVSKEEHCAKPNSESDEARQQNENNEAALLIQKVTDVIEEYLEYKETHIRKKFLLFGADEGKERAKKFRKKITKQQNMESVRHEIEQLIDGRYGGNQDFHSLRTYFVRAFVLQPKVDRVLEGLTGINDDSVFTKFLHAQLQKYNTLDSFYQVLRFIFTQCEDKALKKLLTDELPENHEKIKTSIKTITYPLIKYLTDKKPISEFSIAIIAQINDCESLQQFYPLIENLIRQNDKGNEDLVKYLKSEYPEYVQKDEEKENLQDENQAAAGNRP